MNIPGSSGNVPNEGMFSRTGNAGMCSGTGNAGMFSGTGSGRVSRAGGSGTSDPYGEIGGPPSSLKSVQTPSLQQVALQFLNEPGMEEGRLFISALHFMNGQAESNMH